jgi:hypothetical protein
VKKKAKKKAKHESNAKPSESPKKDEREEKLFDFGGLPDRNLKKNLGC